MSGQWPLEAVIEKKNEKGEWEFAGDIRSVELGEAWIARHGLGDDHRVVPKPAKEG
jgi:hypothetical protein